MRSVRLLSVLVWLTISLSGCMHDVATRVATDNWASLKPSMPTATPDVVELHYIFLEREPNNKVLNEDVWKEADEQVVPLDQKAELQRQGFRVAKLGSRLSPEMMKLLTDKSNHREQGRRHYTHAGVAATVLTTEIRPSWKLPGTAVPAPATAASPASEPGEPAAKTAPPTATGWAAAAWEPLGTAKSAKPIHSTDHTVGATKVALAREAKPGTSKETPEPEVAKTAPKPAAAPANKAGDADGLRMAQGLLRIDPRVGTNDTVTLSIVPEIEYGNRKQKRAPSPELNGWQIRTEREYKNFENLKIDMDLSNGEYVLLGCTSDKTETLGRQFFQRLGVDGQQKQTVLLVRVARPSRDELYTAGYDLDDFFLTPVRAAQQAFSSPARETVLAN